MANRSVCAFCSGRPTTNEHILHRSWKRHFVHLWSDEQRVTVKVAPSEAPGLHRVQIRPDPPFELQVKRACDPCNRGWMNDLDLAIEPSLLAVALHDQTFVPPDLIDIWRRWAIKVAIMRHFQDHPQSPSGTLERKILMDGGVPPGWHVYVARSDEPLLLHANSGFAMEIEPTVEVIPPELKGALAGLTQTSWALGRAIIVAVRAVTPAPMIAALGHDLIAPFNDSNAHNGNSLVELTESTRTTGADFTKYPTFKKDLAPSMMWFAGSPVVGRWDPITGVWRS